jgi:hypothetical protein
MQYSCVRICVCMDRKVLGKMQTVGKRLSRSRTNKRLIAISLLYASSARQASLVLVA